MILIVKSEHLVIFFLLEEAMRKSTIIDDAWDRLNDLAKAFWHKKKKVGVDQNDINFKIILDVVHHHPFFDLWVHSM